MVETLPDAPDAARWARRPTPEERAAQLAHEERLDRRAIRRGFARTVAGCAFWLSVGLAFIAWAFHTADVELGHIVFLSGLTIGYTGILLTLARYYLFGQDEGWW